MGGLPGEGNGAKSEGGGLTATNFFPICAVRRAAGRASRGLWGHWQPAGWGRWYLRLSLPGDTKREGGGDKDAGKEREEGEGGARAGAGAGGVGARGAGQRRPCKQSARGGRGGGSGGARSSGDSQAGAAGGGGGRLGESGRSI